MSEAQTNQNTDFFAHHRWQKLIIRHGGCREQSKRPNKIVDPAFVLDWALGGGDVPDEFRSLAGGGRRGLGLRQVVHGQVAVLEQPQGDPVFGCEGGQKKRGESQAHHTHTHTIRRQQGRKQTYPNGKAMSNAKKTRQKRSHEKKTDNASKHQGAAQQTMFKSSTP